MIFAVISLEFLFQFVSKTRRKAQVARASRAEPLFHIHFPIGLIAGKKKAHL